jgi:hypothetical protein
MKTCCECKWCEKTAETPDELDQCHLNPEHVYVMPNDWCSHWSSKRDGAGDTERMIAEAKLKALLNKHGTCDDCYYWKCASELCSNPDQPNTFTKAEGTCALWRTVLHGPVNTPSKLLMKDSRDGRPNNPCVTLRRWPTLRRWRMSND